jgi:hypothetical protein
VGYKGGGLVLMRNRKVPAIVTWGVFARRETTRQSSNRVAYQSCWQVRSLKMNATSKTHALTGVWNADKARFYLGGTSFSLQSV